MVDWNPEAKLRREDGMAASDYAREREGIKVYFGGDGRVLGTTEDGHGDGYIWNEYRTIPEGANPRTANLRGMSRDDLQKAGWRFIS
jgi:hypothetical protein